MAVRTIEAKQAASVRAMLGEGPVWVEGDQALWFVDIKAPRVHRFAPGTGQLDGWAAPSPVGWVLPDRHGGFVAGLADGLYRFDARSGAFERRVAVEAELPGNRLNDACVDPGGRIWFGSMDDGETDVSGSYYLYAGGAVRRCAAGRACVTNGPAVSPDGATLYTVDSFNRTVDAHAIGANGELSGRRRFLTLGEADGYPDGVTCDSAGGLWLALWGGWAARRYAPDGTQTDEVRFPVANVTKVALGGPDGRTAYATTARQGLDPGALAAQPLAGDLFSFRVEVPGVPTPLANCPESA